MTRTLLIGAGIATMALSAAAAGAPGSHAGSPASASAALPLGSYSGSTSQAEPFSLRVTRNRRGKARPRLIRELRLEFIRRGCTSGAFARTGRLATIYFGSERRRRGTFRFRSRARAVGELDILVRGRMTSRGGRGVLRVGRLGRCSLKSSPSIRWTVHR